MTESEGEGTKEETRKCKRENDAYKHDLTKSMKTIADASLMEVN
jgi:hypothetical protein